jgi:hypothetical protein
LKLKFQGTRSPRENRQPQTPLVRASVGKNFPVLG